MAWYKTGTITVTNGSTTVTGSGTAWILNAAVGEALYAPDGRLYEITNIASDTAFTIAPAYLGSTQAGQAYVIVPSQSYIRDLAAQAADLVNQYSTIAAFAGTGKFGDGTLSAPGIRYSDDLDTGFFRSDTNEVTFVAGGVAQFKYNASGLVFTGATSAVNLSYTGTLTGGTGVINIGSGQVYKDASGNVGVGTSSPATKLAINKNSALTVDPFSNSEVSTVVLENSSATNGNSSAIANRDSGGRTNAYMRFINVDQNYASAITFGTATSGAGSFGERVRIDASGNVGIGTSSPIDKLDVNGNIRIGSSAGDSYFYSTSSGGVLGIQSNTGPIVFLRNNGSNETARIDASGNLLVGTTSATINSSNFGVAITAANQILVARNVTAAVAQFYGSTGENRFLGTGAIQNTLNSYGAISDIKLKENIVDATPKLEKLCQVRIVNFNLIGSEQKQIGVVAQELEKIFPGMVDNNPEEDSEGNPTGETTKSVKYSVFVPMLIKAIQELSAKVDTLQAELNTLKGN